MTYVALEVLRYQLAQMGYDIANESSNICLIIRKKHSPNRVFIEATDLTVTLSIAERCKCFFSLASYITGCRDVRKLRTVDLTEPNSIQSVLTCIEESA